MRRSSMSPVCFSLLLLSFLGCDDTADEAGDPCLSRDLVECGGGGDISQSGSARLGGFLGGAPWFYVQGHAQLLDTADDPALIAYLFDTEYASCDDFPMGVSHLLADLPLATGEYMLSGARSLTFVNYGAEGRGPGNVMTMTGDLIIDTLTADEVSGSMYARAEAGYEVSGRFSLTICP